MDGIRPIFSLYISYATPFLVMLIFMISAIPSTNRRLRNGLRLLFTAVALSYFPLVYLIISHPIAAAHEPTAKSPPFPPHEADGARID